MSPNEFLLASHIIFEYMQAASDTEKLADTQTKFVNDLLQGYKGRDVQQVLLEVGVALERSDRTSSLPGALRTIVYDFDSRAFRALNAAGLYVDALTVLSERLLGPEGLAAMSKTEFAEIKINVSHIGGDVGEEQNLYWRRRVKDFKYQTIGELKNYARAARTAIDATANIFSAATSRTMNKLLGLKQRAETQQNVLIKAKTTIEPFNVTELEVVTRQLLADYLREAASGSNPVLFARRLRAMIDRCLPLRVFEEPYAALSASSGRQWRGIQQTAEEFEREIEEVLRGCTKIIEELIDVMDYTHLPDNLEIDGLIEPFVSASRAAFEKMRIHTDTWLQTISDIQKDLQTELFSEQTSSQL